MPSDGAHAARDDARLQKALSLTGVAPLAAFVVVHVAAATSAAWGAASFDRLMTTSRAGHWLLAAFVLGPLLFHAAYGTYLVAVGRAPARDAWQPTLRRAAAVATLLFVVVHVFDAARAPAGALHDAMTARLSTLTWGLPLVAIVYLVGLAATLVHLGVGAVTFADAWGITPPPVGARRGVAWGSAVVAALLFLLGAHTILYFATGSRYLGPALLESVPLEPHVCPPVQTKPGT